MNKKGFQLLEIDPMGLEIHELAQLNPSMSADQYEEFIKLFDKGFNKEVSHVVLYKGKVVDGRHRTKACKQLGIKMWVRNLPGTMSIEEVEEFVHATENRRHQTVTQRAIGAYKYYLKKQLDGTPISQELAAAKKLSTRKQLARAKDLHALIGDELLDKLHNGEKLLITNSQTKLPVTTDALTTLINYFKNRNEELLVETSSNNTLTDAELELAMTKFGQLQLECNSLVLKKISKLINESQT